MAKRKKNKSLLTDYILKDSYISYQDIIDTVRWYTEFADGSTIPKELEYQIYNLYTDNSILLNLIISAFAERNAL